MGHSAAEVLYNMGKGQEAIELSCSGQENVPKHKTGLEER